MNALFLMVALAVSAGGDGRGDFAVIEIINTTQSPLVYELTWGGETKLFQVEGGQSRWHSFRVDAADENLPLPIVRADCDISDGQRVETFRLLPKFVHDPQAEIGAEYTFGFTADESALEIVPK